MVFVIVALWLFAIGLAVIWIMEIIQDRIERRR